MDKGRFTMMRARGIVMPNVEVSGVPEARPLDRRVGQRPAASTQVCQTTTTVPTASAVGTTGTSQGH
jgi:hypothetical protein